MTFLTDTNVLLRFADRSHVMHSVARAAIRKLRAQGETLCVSAQNFIEFWNVATRPVAVNGLGLSLGDADRSLRRIERLFSLLPDGPAVYPEWRHLVVAFGVSGVKVHDARLVAMMNAHRLTQILTFNTSDFARYASVGIVAVDPVSV